MLHLHRILNLHRYRNGPPSLSGKMGVSACAHTMHNDAFSGCQRTEWKRDPTYKLIVQGEGESPGQGWCRSGCRWPSPALQLQLPSLCFSPSAGPGSTTAHAQCNVKLLKCQTVESVCTSHRGVQVLGSIRTLILFTPARLSSHIQCSPRRCSDMFCLNEGTAPSESLFLWYSSPSVW